MIDDFLIFKRSLEENDKKLFNKCKKSDLHTHALLSSNRNVLCVKLQNYKFEKFKKFEDEKKMYDYLYRNISNIAKNRKQKLHLFECTIITAIKDGIYVLETSINYRLVYSCYGGNIDLFIEDILNLKNKYSDKIKINYDLGISRTTYKKQHFKLILKLINTKVFNGIDIVGDELKLPIKTFKKIYRYAEKKNMVLKAHVGEFGTAKDVYKAIKILHLNVVQHGISIVDNIKIMKYAKNKNIQFNVCPISNLKLSRVEKIQQHPIKKMYEFGLKITINTDDQLIFENSLFDEYMLLYRKKIFTIDDLNKIRLNSFS